ncbi:MAG: phosphatase PAP2 family protein [Pseudomonadota bacterium]|nr:phosphatase PAP2 family protein [Pseudomonadota bacterium]
MIEWIGQVLQSHPEYAMVIAFAFALIESLPFIGSLFPGMLTMPPIGWLIATQQIPPITTFGLILLGAMIGDIIGYIIGCKCQNFAYEKAKAYNKTIWLLAGETFINRYGAMSIIIGRFFGPFRSSIPLFAGIFKMQRLKFILAAIPSVFLWAVIHLAPGLVIAWFDIDLLGQINNIAFIVCVSILSILLASIPMAELILINKFCNSAVSKLTSMLKIEDSNKMVVARSMLTLTAIILTFALIANGSFNHINQTVYNYLSNQNILIIRLSLLQTSLCYIPLILLLTVILSTNYLQKNKTTSACHLMLSVAISFTLCFILKHTILYPRPEHITAFLGNQSLPSGHSCLTTSLILSILFNEKKQLDNSSGRWCKYGAYLFISTTLLARVLIGAHWLSDVFLGWQIGYLSFLIAQIITQQIQAANIVTIIKNHASPLSNIITIELSQTTILAIHSILALLFAAMTNKLSILPYLL